MARAHIPSPSAANSWHPSLSLRFGAEGGRKAAKRKAATPAHPEPPTGDSEGVSQSPRSGLRTGLFAGIAAALAIAAAWWFWPRDVGSIYVTSDPAGVEISIDGTVEGNTPAEVRRVPIGRRRIRLSHPDFRSLDTTVTVARNFIVKLAGLALERRTAVVNVRTKPPGAEVTWDGETKSSTTPLSLSDVVTGDHHLLLVNPGHVEFSDSVRVRAPVTEIEREMASGAEFFRGHWVDPAGKVRVLLDEAVAGHRWAEADSLVVVMQTYDTTAAARYANTNAAAREPRTAELRGTIPWLWQTGRRARLDAALAEMRQLAPADPLIERYGSGPIGGQLMRTLRGHKHWVRSVAITPDGQRLLSGGRADRWKHTPGKGSGLILWELDTGRMLKVLSDSIRVENQGNSWYRRMYGELRALAIAPNGRSAFAGDTDPLWEWDLRTRRVSRALTDTDGYLPIPLCVSISPDGRWLASGHQVEYGRDGSGNSYAEGRVRLWRLSDGKIVRKYVFDEGEQVDAIGILPDATAILAGSRDGKLRLWRRRDGRLLRTVRAHTGYVRGIAVTDDGTRAITVGGDEYEPTRGVDGEWIYWAPRDRAVKIWSMPDLRLLHTMTGHTDWVSCVALSPDDKYIATGSGDKTVRVWRMSDGAHVRTIRTGHTKAVMCIAISPDGKWIVTGSEDTTIKVFRAPW